MSPSTLVHEVENQAVAAAHGDTDSLGELYEQFADPLLRFLILRTQNNVALAEDIAGTTWERVARGIRGYETRGSGFPAWLFTVARRALADHYRWTGRRPERLDGEMLAHDKAADTADGPCEVVERKLNGQRVAAEVRTLSPAQRKCVTLRFFVGLSLSETAAVMGKNTNSVKQLQHRALATLHRRLGETDMERPHAETLVIPQVGASRTPLNSASEGSK